MSSIDLTHPAAVLERLVLIERDLAIRQNVFEEAARGWYQARREVERVKARELLSADEKSVTEKKARAELAAYDVEGAGLEAEYEALRAVIRVLEQRSMVLMAVLKSQGRA